MEVTPFGATKFACFLTPYHENIDEKVVLILNMGTTMAYFDIETYDNRS
jgi:hypothetical protein